MNDRSQGGTADLTEPGTIELMQMRAMNHSDKTQGFNHIVSDETASKATYFLQIDRSGSK